jgi:hypothetical protein
MGTYSFQLNSDTFKNRNKTAYNTQYTRLPASALANVGSFGYLSGNQTALSYECRQLGILPTLGLSLVANGIANAQARVWQAVPALSNACFFAIPGLLYNYDSVTLRF